MQTTNVKSKADIQTAYRSVVGFLHPDKIASLDVDDATRNAALEIMQRINALYNSESWDALHSLLELVREYGLKKDLTQARALLAKLAEPKPQEKAKAKANDTKSEPKVDTTILERARAKERETGWDRSKIASWLNLEYDLRGKSAKVYLDLIFTKGETQERGDTVKASFYRLLKTGPVTTEQVDAWIKAQNRVNVDRHRSYYLDIAKLTNAVWELAKAK